MSDLKRRKLSHEGRPSKKAKPAEEKPQSASASESESESNSEDESATVDVAPNEEQQEPEVKKTFAELVCLSLLFWLFAQANPPRASSIPSAKPVHP